jgi:DNA adenine methylase
LCYDTYNDEKIYTYSTGGVYLAKKNTKVKPYLKWAGGKRQLLPVIENYIPDENEINTYYEPFIGAGAVLFARQPSNAVINDHNTQLITTYKVIKDQVEELIRLLQAHKESNTKEYFYDIREQDRKLDTFNTLSDVEKAARFIYLNKTCYNGLYRVNSQGLFNVPFGKYKNPAICEEITLRSINQYFNSSNITILNGDFSEAVKNAGEGDFVYLDPPYHSPNNMNFTGYQAGGFNEGEQVRLYETYLQLTSKNVKCLLSNSDTDFIRDLYKDFNIHTVKATRAINSDASKRGKVNEVLVQNW